MALAVQQQRYVLLNTKGRVMSRPLVGKPDKLTSVLYPHAPCILAGPLNCIRAIITYLFRDHASALANVRQAAIEEK